MIESLVSWEKELFLLLNSPHNYYLDSVMYLISDKYPWIIYGVILLALCIYKQKRSEVLLLLLAVTLLIFIGDQLSSQIIKPWVQRYRPTHHPETCELVQTVLGYRGGSYGFISGHTTNFVAFALFTSLVFRVRRYTIISLLTAFTVAYSRIYLGVHFITDVIPGIFVGAGVAYFVYVLYIWARRFWFKLPAESAIYPYIAPTGRKIIIANSLIAFYIAIWTLSPLVFIMYQ